MNKREQVQTKVRELYLMKDPNRDEWTDWLYDNHVLIVAHNARELARKYHASEELSKVAALLHDIADVQMAHVSPDHEKVSLDIARAYFDCAYVIVSA